MTYSHFHFCVVEDCEVDACLAKEEIKKAFPGAKITCVHSIKEAEQLINELASEIDFFIIDNNLPDGQGLSLVDHINRNRSLIFMCSGVQESHKDSFSKKIDAFILKPLTVNALKAGFRGARWLNKMKD